MGIWVAAKHAINSTLGTTEFKSLDKIIKHQTWIENLQIFGTESYVYKNKKYLSQITSEVDVCANDVLLTSLTYEEFEKQGKIGLLFSKIKGINNSEIIKNLRLTNDLVSNQTAINSIVANTTAASHIFMNERLLDTVFANTEALNSVANSEIAMNAIALNEDAALRITSSETKIILLMNSNTSIKIAFAKAFNKSYKALQDIYNTLQNTNKFTKTVDVWSSSMSDLNKYMNTNNTIIMIATGFYQNNPYNYIITKMSGIEVSDGRLVNSHEPKTVNKNNVGAAAFATAKFGNHNYAQAAIHVYKIK